MNFIHNHVRIEILQNHYIKCYHHYHNVESSNNVGIKK